MIFILHQLKDGTEYKFEGLNNKTRTLFRFIVLTLRKYFGYNLYFERKKGEIIIPFLSYERANENTTRNR
jgi:hypothetical protein